MALAGSTAPLNGVPLTTSWHVPTDAAATDAGRVSPQINARKKQDARTSGPTDETRRKPASTIATAFPSALDRLAAGSCQSIPT